MSVVMFLKKHVTTEDQSQSLSTFRNKTLKKIVKYNQRHQLRPKEKYHESGVTISLMLEEKPSIS